MVRRTMGEGSLHEGAVAADPYKLKLSLGGGFGVACRAHDATLGRRFVKEARVLAAINHPNELQVLDDGEWPPSPPRAGSAIPSGRSRAFPPCRSHTSRTFR